ncbi:MAG: LysE family translocator [Nocardiopsaceae bacterium]|nr:LysE family translocator [Nocardiopsaceae bacterium]
MTGEVYWAAFVPSAIAMAATPGANQLLALRNGLRHGPVRAIGATLGRFTAFALMVAAVAGGVGALLVASQLAFSVLKWGGVAYLTWLGIRTILTAGRAGQTGAHAPVPDGEPGRKAPLRRLARQEFVVAAANPKALILFTVFLPQFVTAGGRQHIAEPILIVGAAYIAVEFCCACGYATLGGRLGLNGIRESARRWLDRGTGVAMLGLAGWLATENA